MMRRLIKTILKILLFILLFFVVMVVAINVFVCTKTTRDIHSLDEFSGNYDYIIVLGCGIYDNSIPTPMMSDRLDAAISLYNQGFAPYILMSGDHRVDDYNEVRVMKEYCVEHGVPEEVIFTDDYGLSTYESMKRASEIYSIESAVVVTQQYHLYRAIYNAQSMNINCEGVIATGHEFVEQPYYSLREVLARVKDFFLCIAY